jgi:hypothetical protein
MFLSTGIAELASPFKYALVERFPNGRPSMDILRKEILTVGFKGYC